MACRTSAAMFDVSHLGTVRVRGDAAHRSLQWALTNDLDRVGVGSAQYTHLLDASDASVLDDIIVWWIGPDLFDVMPNASNTDRVVGALREGSGDLDIADVTADRAVIAVQGPEARARLAAAGAEDIASVGRFKVAATRFGKIPVTVAGTGYTGEDGVEMAVGVDDAPVVWQRLVDAGVSPAGLGARDTLRLEAGLPLHGHELGPGITPLQAGLGWVVRWDKGDFRGRSALEAEREAGPRRRLRGLLADKGRPPRDGCAWSGRATTRSEWSPAATSRRCWDRASPWRSWRQTSGLVTRWSSTCGAGIFPPRWSSLLSTNSGSSPDTCRSSHRRSPVGRWVAASQTTDE